MTNTTKRVPRSELAILVADRTGVDKKTAARVLDAATDIISEVVLNDGAEVRLQGFGTFSLRRIAPRNVPGIGLSRPSSKVKFKPYANLTRRDPS